MIIELYERLKDLGVVFTQAAFSSDFLGRGRRYFDYLKSSGAEASVASLTVLAIKLSRAADEAGSNGEFQKAHAVRKLSEKAWREVGRRAGAHANCVLVSDVSALTPLGRSYS